MNKLFTKFKGFDQKDWENNIKLEFNKEHYHKLFKEIEGIKISPFYHKNNLRSDIEFPKEFENYQLIDASNPISGNKKALEALKNGMSGLCFSNPKNLDILLNKIKTEYIRINFMNYSKSFIKELEKYSKKHKLIGAIHGSEEVKIKNIQNTIYANGNTAKEQIDNVFNKGLLAKNNMQFHFTINNNFFLEIAKLRAFRILWKNKTGQDPYIFTSTGIKNKNKKDKYNNIFKTTTECMSAILGGANTIMTQAYNISYENSNDFSDRIARNQHKILLNESYLDKVKDPSNGSYYIEFLTKELLKGYDIKKSNSNTNDIDTYNTAEQIKIKSYYYKKIHEKIYHFY